MNKWKSVGMVSGLTLGLVLLQSGVVLAAAAGGEMRWADFGWRILNIIIFVAILWKFLGKTITSFLSGRREGIQQELDDLDVQRAEAKKKLDEVEASIANLAAERQAILDESQAQAEASKKAIIADANVQAEQIIAQARRTAENEGRAVLADVRAAIADDIVNAAAKALESKLGAQEHTKLINNSLTKVVLN